MRNQRGKESMNEEIKFMNIDKLLYMKMNKLLDGMDLEE